MPLPDLDAYKVKKDYAADFKTSSLKAKASALPFRFIKAFEFGDGKKAPLLLIGKLPPTLLEMLKQQSGTGKVKASGLCRLVANALEFEVEKGSLDDDEVALALKTANANALADGSKVVATLSDGSSVKAKALDVGHMKHRFVKLQERLKALTSLEDEEIRSMVVKFKALSGDLKALQEGGSDAAGATVEELLDALEQGIVPLEKKHAAKGKELRADASPDSPARTETAPPVDVKQLTKAILVIAKDVDEAESRIGDYEKDPNGFLLLIKKITSSGAALKTLGKAVDKAGRSSDNSALVQSIAELEKRLLKLGEVAKVERQKIATWSQHIHERQQALGADIGKKKYIAQEGEIGADMEMSVGGLKRGAINEVEFDPGPFSPYLKKGSTESPDDGPHQFDVFGITAAVVKKVMPLSARKVYPLLNSKTIGEAELWNVLRVMTAPTGVQLGDMASPVVVDPTQVVERYLRDAKFFAGLEHHFQKGLKGQEKPTVVPLDVSGMGLWPFLLDHVKHEIDQRFPKQKHLILWQDK